MSFKIDSYSYEQGALIIGYYEGEDDNKKHHLLPNSALITALKDTDLIFDGNPYSDLVKVGACYPWITVQQFTSANLGHGMAERLLSHYLGNQTDKASGNYKTYTI